MNTSTQVQKFDKVTLKDWLLALTGLLFTLSGLVIIRNDFQVGITTIALFGSCFAVSVHIILRKLRLRKQLLLEVSVRGGEPIRPSRARIAILGLGLLVIGTILTYFEPGNNKIMFGCALLIAITGGVLLVGLFTGLLSKSYIQFDPPGITLGYLRGKATIPWSAIIKVDRGEIHNNQAIFLWVNREAVHAEPSSFLAFIHKKMASSQTWLGADFAIITSRYGIDAPILLATINKYAASPEARDELRSATRLGV